MGRFLVVLTRSCVLLLLLEFLVDGPEQRRWLESFLVFHWRLPCLKCPGVVAYLNRLGDLIITAVLQVDALQFPAGHDLPEDDEIVNGHLVEDIPLILVILMQDEAYMRAGELEIQRLFLLLLEAGLRVIVGIHQPQLPVLLVPA